MTPRRVLGNGLVVATAAALDLVAWAGDSELRGGGALPFVVVPLVTLLLYPVLAWRERSPVLVFAVLWVHALGGAVLPRYLPLAALLVALHAVAAHRPARTSLAAAASCSVPFLLDAVNVTAYSDGGSAFGNGAIALWILSVAGACAWFLGHRSLRAAERRRRDRSTYEATMAHTLRAERLAMARELHDTVANAVNAMLLQAAGARRAPPTADDRAWDALRTIETTGVAAMEEMRRLLDVLREPGGAASPDRAPGLADLRVLLDRSEGAGQDVRASIDPDRPEVDRAVDLVAYRVVQEGLANAAKHAPGAPVEVAVACAASSLVVTVRSGTPARRRGPRPASTGVGLVGLRERVRLVDGEFDAGATAEGFELSARLPARVVDRAADRVADRVPAPRAAPVG